MSNYEYLSANSQDIKTFKLKQKIKNLLILLIIGIPIALGFAAYLYYKSITKNKETAKIQTAENSQHAGVTEGVNSNQDLSSNSDQQLPGQNSVSVTQNNNQSSSSVPVAGYTSNIPPEVVTTLNHTETNGITNNPYIDSRLDTSQYTSDAKITFDRSTWILQNTNQGSIDFTIKLSGVSKNGTSTLGNSSGTWKIIGYAIKD